MPPPEGPAPTGDGTPQFSVIVPVYRHWELIPPLLAGPVAITPDGDRPNRYENCDNAMAETINRPFKAEANFYTTMENLNMTA